MKKSISPLTAALLLFPGLALAQADNADFMRSVGKMYVVYGVIVVIFIVLILFLIYLDRRLTKLENQIKDQ
jgi:hypothetical protein